MLVATTPGQRFILASLVTVLLLLSYLHFNTGLPSRLNTWRSGQLLSRPAGSALKTYLPYTFGYASLLQTLHAYDHAGWKDIVVFDNSWDYHAFEDRHRLMTEFDSVVDVIKTPVRLRFSQIQGMIDNIAREEGADAYLWGHTDTILLTNGTSSPYDRMGKCLAWARNERNHEKPAAVVFLALYDLINVVFVQPSASAPWDPSMPQYGSDCDRYERLRLAGYSLVTCPEPIGAMVLQHTVISHEDKERLWHSGLGVDEQVKMLAEINKDAEQYQWRQGAGGGQSDRPDSEEKDVHGGFGRADELAQKAEHEGGTNYFVAKWGFPFDCEIGGRTPNFDIPGVIIPPA